MDAQGEVPSIWRDLDGAFGRAPRSKAAAQSRRSSGVPCDRLGVDYSVTDSFLLVRCSNTTLFTLEPTRKPSAYFMGWLPPSSERIVSVLGNIGQKKLECSRDFLPSIHT